MSKLYHCEVCGKSYKNSRSLNTHKYSYHTEEGSGLRNTPSTSTIKSDFDEYSHHSGESSEVQDTAPDKTYDSQEHSPQNMSTDKLNRLFDLEIKSWRMERQLQSIQSKLDITRDDGFTPSEIVRLESLINSNKRDIMKLHEKTVSEENDREADDLAARDLVDDTIEMQTLFAENQFDKIILDIPKTRLVIKFMLTFMDLSKIDDKEIRLLREISNASKTVARALIKNGFTQLVNIFDQLKTEFDEMLESESESESDEEITDSDEETEKSDVDSDQESEEDSAEKSDIDSDQESEEDSAEKSDIDSDQESEEDSAEKSDIDSDQESEEDSAEKSDIDSNQESEEDSAEKSDIDSD